MPRLRHAAAAAAAALSVFAASIAVGQVASSAPTSLPVAAFQLGSKTVAEGQDIVLTLLESTTYGQPTGINRKFRMPESGSITWKFRNRIGFYRFRIAPGDGSGGDLVEPIQARVRPVAVINPNQTLDTNDAILSGELFQIRGQLPTDVVRPARLIRILADGSRKVIQSATSRFNGTVIFSLSLPTPAAEPYAFQINARAFKAGANKPEVPTFFSPEIEIHVVKQSVSLVVPSPVCVGQPVDALVGVSPAREKQIGVLNQYVGTERVGNRPFSFTKLGGVTSAAKVSVGPYVATSPGNSTWVARVDPFAGSDQVWSPPVTVETRDCSEPTPTESPSPTESPTITPTESPSPTESPTASPTSSPSPSESPTITPPEPTPTAPTSTPSTCPSPGIPC